MAQTLASQQEGIESNITLQLSDTLASFTDYSQNTTLAAVLGAVAWCCLSSVMTLPHGVSVSVLCLCRHCQLSSHWTVDPDRRCRQQQLSPSTIAVAVVCLRFLVTRYHLSPLVDCYLKLPFCLGH